MARLSLEGHTALITGATSGYGLATARILADDGARVILVGRRRDRLEKVANELGSLALALELDVRDTPACTHALDTLPTPFQAIDILVNNAGLALGMGPAWEAELSDWETMIATNTLALASMTRLILPGMIARGRGHIVNLSSISGTHPYPGGHVYGATKAFVTQFSANLRVDLVHTPIRVTNIEPGMSETEFSLVRFHGDAPKADAVYRNVAALQAEDIADAVHWALTRPAHVDVSRIEIFPTAQADAGLTVHRTEG